MPNVLKAGYKTKEQAAIGLLANVANVLPDRDDYIVVGGWTPFLLNRRDDVRHPGTRDVDILFEDAEFEGRLKDTVERFLSKDFFLSAKHEFQVFRLIEIAGGEFAFNVDLLHPAEAVKDRELWVQHFEFKADQDYAVHAVRSIALPSSAAFFKEKMYTRENVPGHEGVSVNLLTPAGMVLSKCRSVKEPKRPRDAFDIYLMLTQPDSDVTVQELKKLCKFAKIKREMRCLVEYLKDKPDEFDKRVLKYFPDAPAKASDFIINVVGPLAT